MGWRNLCHGCRSLTLRITKARRTVLWSPHTSLTFEKDHYFCVTPLKTPAQHEMEIHRLTEAGPIFTTRQEL